MVLALAAWALTWLLTFWSKLDSLRARFGVGFDVDGNGYPIERWASSSAGEWLNCPACCAVIGAVIVGLWWVMGLPMVPLRVLAALGLLLLILRWWQGARTKAEWWA